MRNAPSVNINFRGTPALKRAIEAAAKRIAKARKLPGYTASDFLREVAEAACEARIVAAEGAMAAP